MTDHHSPYLSTFLHRNTATLPVRNLPALLVSNLPAVGLGHVTTVIDRDCLTVQIIISRPFLAVGGLEDISPVGWLARLSVL